MWPGTKTRKLSLSTATVIARPIYLQQNQATMDAGRTERRRESKHIPPLLLADLVLVAAVVPT